MIPSTHRVVVTGMGGLCPIGNTWPDVRANLLGKHSGIQYIPEWETVQNMRTRLGGRVKGADNMPKHWPRKKTRTMGRVAMLAAQATESALQQSGLLESPELQQGSCGVAYGSTYGSPPAFDEFFSNASVRRNLDGVNASQFIKFMAHTCAANLAQFFGLRGRVIPTTCACTAGSQGIVYAYEALKYGRQSIMIAGGAEELHYLSAAVFDVMFATSTRNNDPTSVPRPFDESRDGLVVGEGAATLILETLEHAQARGVPILAEIVGAGTNCDGLHMVNPSPEGMEAVMRLSLQDAGLTSDQIGFVNMHGTSTDVGDVAESVATFHVFQRAVPAASLKSYMGHTLGACGAIEAWLGISMQQEGWMPPTLHLNQVDEACGALDFLREPRQQGYEYFMTNNFAFGGVNTSLIFRKWTP
ncbi:MAG TPA: beta-ketoacyl-ACP synthase [Fibrobacteraceae bacterium]|nr:beta-ketoacyl-ACP synthase [Fibrobacteraceae bacterium]